MHKVQLIVAGPLATNCYIIFEEISKKAVVIDLPPDSFDKIQTVLTDNDLSVEALFLTHTHWDHAADGSTLLKEYNIPLYVHQDDEHRILDPMTHSVLALPFKIEAYKADNYFTDGQKLSIADMDFEIMHTPGHTQGGVCIINHNAKVVFTGDTLFRDSVGRSDLPGGDGDVLLDSLKNKIMTLPDDYMVLPGHGPDSIIGDERQYNRFCF